MVPLNMCRGALSRCLEEMGDWAKVLEIIDVENTETAALTGVSDLGDGQGDDAMEAELAPPDDARLFLKADKWDGPQFLRRVTCWHPTLTWRHQQ